LKVLAVIPARGGSKRIQKKNIKELKEKPLIQWTIETAQQSKKIDRLVVSTEDKEISDICKGLGVEVIKRPKKLATDGALMIDVVLDAIKQTNVDGTVVLLQPTSPLRSVVDIDNVIHMSKTCEVVVSIDEKHEYNGAVYAADIEYLQEKLTFFGPDTYNYVMPNTRSIDIDHPGDFELAEKMHEFV